VRGGEHLGRLLLGTGPRTEPFGPADRRLLAILGQQVGMAAENQLLAARLQRSLEHTVSTREEERRRLRRDIHDGLGPMLAAGRMRLEVALRLLPTQPSTASAILNELASTHQLMIDDVRRLVDGLRPPVLDELGLVAAIRRHAAAFDHSGPEPRLAVEVDAEHGIEPLPAAVEIAAYRIALEALTNVARHAQAHSCHIGLRRADFLELDIADDGRGLPERYRSGVGLSSMRERAAEVGGQCQITSRPGMGTLVSARLPLQGRGS
jgi:signal transduction histidine kinase